MGIHREVRPCEYPLFDLLQLFDGIEGRIKELVGSYIYGVEHAVCHS